MAEMKRCMSCGVKQSGVRESNKEWFDVRNKYIDLAKKAGDSKALLELIRSLSERIRVQVQSFDSEGNATGDLCIDPYVSKKVTILLEKASIALNTLEKEKKDYPDDRF
ncbi:hypothetical protein [Salmonella phage SSBI34]|nr:hypothetical protein [Salmonella phage SSBI34]